MFWKKTPPGTKVEWMIVGLGNPGGEYAGTRHNVGFMVIDRLAERLKVKLDRGKHRARYGTGRIGETPVLLVKPMTFMNLSGQAIGPLAREQEVPATKILVVADELDFPLGKTKLKPKGGSGGHNGHKSLIASLRTDEYPRIRIGIGSVDKSETMDHVLSAFDQDERPVVEDQIGRVVQLCIDVVEQGLDKAMAQFNEGSRGE